MVLVVVETGFHVAQDDPDIVILSHTHTTTTLSTGYRQVPSGVTSVCFEM